jgi:hypothetical protein
MSHDKNSDFMLLQGVLILGDPKFIAYGHTLMGSWPAGQERPSSGVKVVSVPLSEAPTLFFCKLAPDASVPFFVRPRGTRHLNQVLNTGMQSTRLPTSMAVLISRMTQRNQTGSVGFVKTATLRRIAEMICVGIA